MSHYQYMRAGIVNNAALTPKLSGNLYNCLKLTLFFIAYEGPNLHAHCKLVTRAKPER
jgi:hypothetical protein